MKPHRCAVPLGVLLTAPDEGSGDDVMAIAKNVRPNVDGFTDDPLHGKARAVNAGIYVFDVESIASDVPDQSVRFVHDNNAQLLTKTPNTRDEFREERVQAIYQAREGALVPLEPGRSQTVTSQLSC